MKLETLHALVVEEQPDVVQLLEEAFLEIEEIRFARPWMRLCRRTFVPTLEEALSLLRERTFDAILLGLAVSGNRESSAFELIHDLQRITPLIALVHEGEEARAFSLIQQGAQDYLALSDLDCVPLAKTLRAAVERSRHTLALEQFAGLPTFEEARTF
jgi:CheY-like chemotaxis protein